MRYMSISPNDIFWSRSTFCWLLRCSNGMNVSILSFFCWLGTSSLNVNFPLFRNHSLTFLYTSAISAVMSTLLTSDNLTSLISLVPSFLINRFSSTFSACSSAFIRSFKLTFLFLACGVLINKFGTSGNGWLSISPSSSKSSSLLNNKLSNPAMCSSTSLAAFSFSNIAEASIIFPDIENECSCSTFSVSMYLLASLLMSMSHGSICSVLTSSWITVCHVTSSFWVSMWYILSCIWHDYPAFALIKVLKISHHFKMVT